VRALRGLLLPGCLSTVPVSRNFFNSLLTPRFVSFSEEISVFEAKRLKNLLSNLVLVVEYRQALQ